MDKIVKICKKHGELEASLAYIQKKINAQGVEYVKQIFCKSCKNASNLKWQKAHPAKVREYAIKHKDKIRARFKAAKYHKSNAAKLTNGYVKNVLNAIYKIPFRDIPAIAITIKREALKVHRAKGDTTQFVEALDKIFGRVVNVDK